MANKKSFFGLKFVYDAPATLTFAFICIVLFAVDTLLLKNQLGANYLSSPTTAGGKLAFMASNPLSYIRLIAFAFGAASASVLTSIVQSQSLFARRTFCPCFPMASDS